MLTIPTGQAVIAYLGWPSDSTLIAQADAHAAQAATLVRAYTRGRGFVRADPLVMGSVDAVEEDLASVIITYAARSLSNPTSARDLDAGSFKESPGSPWSFSLVESLVLQGHRRMAG